MALSIPAYTTDLTYPFSALRMEAFAQSTAG